MNYRTRIASPTPYERALVDALFAILGRGDHRIEAIVAGLRESGVEPPGGAWTVETFRAEIARLGAGPSGGPAPAIRY